MSFASSWLFAIALLSMLTASLSAVAPDEVKPPVGVDILPLVRQATKQLHPTESPVPGRPWSDDLAALTDEDPTVASQAIGRLVRRGAEILPDLAVLGKARDWQVRVRVIRVAAGIGGSAGAPLVIALSHDSDPRVRRAAAVGLGRCRGEPVLARLLELIVSPSSDEREGAASSLGALGDIRAIRSLCRLRRDGDGPARAAQTTALASLVRSPNAPAEVANLLGTLVSEDRLALLETLEGATDTRLCPALAARITDREALAVLLAVRALATAGDARAVEALVQLAVSERLPDLRDAAASTLRVLTGYRAGAGPAWALWWREHAAAYAERTRRDALIADIMDPTAAIPVALAKLPADELTPLLDAATGSGRPVPPWFPQRALAVLRQQTGLPWIQPLAQRIDNAPDSEARLDVLVLLDELGGMEAAGEFARQQDLLNERETKSMELWKDKGVIPPDIGAERVIIHQALKRRGR